jgi:hypothetical protein
LLVGRESLKGGEIGDDEIEGGKIRNDEENIETVDCEKFFLNYVDCCAVSIYFANLIINKATIEIANIY